MYKSERASFWKALPWFRLHMWGDANRLDISLISLPYIREFKSEKFVAYPALLIAILFFILSSLALYVYNFHPFHVMFFLISSFVLYAAINYCWAQEKIVVTSEFVNFYKTSAFKRRIVWQEPISGYSSLTIVQSNHGRYHLLLENPHRGKTVALILCYDLSEVINYAEVFSSLLKIKINPTKIVCFVGDASSD